MSTDAAAARGLIAQRLLGDGEVEAAMIDALREAVGPSATETVAADTALLKKGEEVDRIWVLLDGRVRLFQDTPEGEVVFHSETVGPIIGLLALATGQPSYFSCRTVTEVQAICLTIDELDALLQGSSNISRLFTAVLVRSLARRNHRAIELQLEIATLNRALAGERDQLSSTLAQLKRAEMQVVEHEKMATLGELARGVAHELNNPVAAIVRSADFLADDLRHLVAGLPNGARDEAAIDRALDRPPLTTREFRRTRRELAAALGDEALAERLVAAGIYDEAAYRAAVEGAPDAEREVQLGQVESCHQLGTAIRSIRSCAERITALVKSLRSYARTDSETVAEADLHVGIDETLMLFGHQLRNVEVVRHFAELPPVGCRPGELNQVWTNLVSNALEAMGKDGVLRIETARQGEDHVQVMVIDSGPGVAPANLDRIFEVNFTTRGGPTGFGLGIGLPICREIIQRHGGTINVASEPGRTCFTVTLPVRPAPGDIA